MEILLFVAGFFLGAVLGSGLMLLYIRRKFTQSVSRMEEQMQMIQEIGQEQERKDD